MKAVRIWFFQKNKLFQIKISVTSFSNDRTAYLRKKGK